MLWLSVFSLIGPGAKLSYVPLKEPIKEDLCTHPFPMYWDFNFVINGGGGKKVVGSVFAASSLMELLAYYFFTAHQSEGNMMELDIFKEEPSLLPFQTCLRQRQNVRRSLVQTEEQTSPVIILCAPFLPEWELIPGPFSLPIYIWMHLLYYVFTHSLVPDEALASFPLLGPHIS